MQNKESNTLTLISNRSGNEYLITVLKEKDLNVWKICNLTKGHICKCEFGSEEEAWAEVMINMHHKDDILNNLEWDKYNVYLVPKKSELIRYSMDPKHELEIEFKGLPYTSPEVQKKAKEALKWLTERNNNNDGE